MSAGNLMTPENAPRSEEELLTGSAKGVFAHRRLAESLFDRGFKLWTTDKEKTAFLTATAEVRAQSLLQMLKKFDEANGRATPAPAPAAAAAPAPAAEPAPAKRQPRTSAAAAPAAPAPAQTAEVPNGGAQELLNALKYQGTQVGELHQRLDDIDGQLAAKLPGIHKELADIKAMLSATAQLQKVQLGLLCLFGQQVLSAGLPEILEASVGDANTALELLEQLGKA